jgi:small multidrug resistance pump
LLWAGCGTALVGIVWFGESAGLLRLSGMGMIVGGVVVLNLGAR